MVRSTESSTSRPENHAHTPFASSCAAPARAGGAVLVSNAVDVMSVFSLGCSAR